MEETLVYLFLSFEPEDRLRLDDDLLLLLLLFELERVRCTDDPELERLLDDLTLLPDRLELLLLALLTETLLLLLTADSRTADPTRFKKLPTLLRLELPLKFTRDERS